MKSEPTIKLIEGDTIPEVWMKAVRFLSDRRGREFFDLILHIKKPTVVNKADVETIKNVEKFLKKHDGMPVATVAETIFPMSYYKRGGRTAVFEDYVRDIQKIREERPDESNGWGLYALRMLHYIKPNGESFNQLEKVIEKIGAKAKYQNCFEVSSSEELRTNYFEEETGAADLSIFEPSSDSGRYYGGPCLSHVSFKRDKRLDQMRLNATYRSHFYIQRALGNLIGLSNLLLFVAKETQQGIGALTINATYAKLDTGADNKGTWTHKNVIALLDECENLYDTVDKRITDS
ncbi:MAG: hypothetical protein ABJG88_11480 [Litorimonas sp.]